MLVLTAGYKNAPAEESRDGFHIVRVPAWTMPKNRLAANFDIAFTISPRAKKLVDTILDDFAPDVIHQHGQFFDLTWLSGLWARSRKVPTLLSIHTRLETPNKLNNAIFRCADALLVAPLMRLHKPTLVVMDVLMDRYIGMRYRKAISGKVVIPVGINPTALAGGDGARARAEHDLADRHVLLSIGHVIPQRNRVPLVRALPRILERYPDLAVVVIGGVYHDEFLRLAKELGVEESIDAVGAIPQKQIPDYLAAADLEVHELQGQGFGTASLECLAMGIPVVADIPADNFVEVLLEDRRHLYLVPPVGDTNADADPDALADIILEILADPQAARDRVSEHAKQLIQDHFTIDHVAARHLSVLSDLTGAQS